MMAITIGRQMMTMRTMMMTIGTQMMMMTIGRQMMMMMMTIGK